MSTGSMACDAGFELGDVRRELAVLEEKALEASVLRDLSIG